MNNHKYDSTYVIMSNTFFYLLFLVHEIWQLINETSSMNASEQGSSWKWSNLQQINPKAQKKKNSLNFRKWFFLAQIFKKTLYFFKGKLCCTSKKGTLHFSSQTESSSSNIFKKFPMFSL